MILKVKSGHISSCVNKNEKIENCTNIFCIDGYTMTSFDIPDEVTHIDDDTFSCCYKLKHIGFPAGLKYIGENAFDGCVCLEAHIPEKVEYIGSYAFHGTKLKNLRIPDTMTKIESNAFSGCGSLESVEIPNSVLEIGECAFMCSSLKYAVIHDSIKTIGFGAFTLCGLKQLTLIHGNRKILLPLEECPIDELETDGGTNEQMYRFAEAVGTPNEKNAFAEAAPMFVRNNYYESLDIFLREIGIDDYGRVRRLMLLSDEFHAPECRSVLARYCKSNK